MDGEWGLGEVRRTNPSNNGHPQHPLTSLASALVKILQNKMVLANRLAMISGRHFDLHNGGRTCLVAEWSSSVAILNIRNPGEVIDPQIIAI